MLKKLYLWSILWISLLTLWLIQPTQLVDLHANDLLPSLQQGIGTRIPLIQLPKVTTSTYLPVLLAPDGFLRNKAIWPHAQLPQAHEVALFRHQFTLTEPLPLSTLTLFADTRYEVWLDGVWVGRGPARFSKKTHEYDQYSVGSLTPGEHLLAVLGQWAPNNRRSESVTPFIRGHLEGQTQSGKRIVITRTDHRWQAIKSPAWRSDAAQVHVWQLLGPTELLNLNHLPVDWFHPNFDDQWAPAVVKSIDAQPIYRLRSIPLLANILLTPTLVEAGLLSPDHQIAQLSEPYTFTFETNTSTILKLDILTGTQLIDTVRPLLDGQALTWQSGPLHRPDVQIATPLLEPGLHTLSFLNIPPEGLPFAISSPLAQTASLPFQPSRHAGRRLLLADPISQPEKVLVSTETGLSLTFPETPAYVVLDLGHVRHGRLVAEVQGPENTILDIGWDERLMRDVQGRALDVNWQARPFSNTLRPLPYPGSLHPHWNQVDSWILDGTKREITTLDARTGRYLLLAVWGEGPVHLAQVQVQEERYPVVQRGWFTSSNPRLDRIWQIGVDTLSANMVDAYADPWRERGQWWGDAYADDHINRVAFGDTDLLRRGLYFMAEAFVEGRPPALAPSSDSTLLLDYGMLWVQSLKDYADLAANIVLLESIYPILVEFLTYLEDYDHEKTGLLDVPFGHWSETSLIDWAARASRSGQSTALNAMYYGTLLDAASLAEIMGDLEQATLWQQKAQFIKQQINQTLFNQAKDQYITTMLNGEVIDYEFSDKAPHAQAWALAYQVVPDDKVDQVMQTLLNFLAEDPDYSKVEMYGMHWLLKALGDRGHITEGVALIDAYYGRLVDQGATTWGELFLAHQRYASSLSHAWSGSPTWFLSTYVLGAKTIDGQTWQVKPALTLLDHASGAIPLANGTLQIMWHHQSCLKSQLHLNTPQQTSGQVIIPVLEGLTEIRLDDHLIWQDHQPLDNYVIQNTNEIIIMLTGGETRLTLDYSCFRPSRFLEP